MQVAIEREKWFHFPPFLAFTFFFLTAIDWSPLLNSFKEFGVECEFCFICSWLHLVHKMTCKVCQMLWMFVFSFHFFEDWHRAVWIFLKWFHFFNTVVYKMRAYIVWEHFFRVCMYMCMHMSMYVYFLFLYPINLLLW